MPKSHSSVEDDFAPAKGISNMLSDCDHDDRIGFVRKVYSILAVQLSITFGFVALVKTNEVLNASIS